MSMRLHQDLAWRARQKLAPRTPAEDAAIPAELEARARAFLVQECAAVAERAALAPAEPEAFACWFEELCETGPGQGDPLFPYLAQRATREQMRWFLAQESAGEAGFDDLVALTQLRFPIEPKLEMAHNYWDEMGGGHEVGMHGPMLTRLGQELELASLGHETVWQALALSNLMTGFALDRSYAYHSAGALGVVELTAPGRCEHVARGLERLGIGPAARKYYTLHASIDITHSRRWNEHVLRPLVAARPELARWLAEGALARLAAGARTFDRYRSELGLARRAGSAVRIAS
jgi:hypothetical protein